MASTTVNFNLKTAGFANFANQTLSFRLLTAGADKTDDTVVLPGVVTATSAADGTGSVALFRNGDSDIDSVFEVIFPNREKSKFVIPVSTSSIHLSDLLVDHVPSGSDTQQSSVYAAAIQRANHTGTQLLSTISDSSTVQLKPSEGAFANGDKTKLDGIEAGATADQTSEEIQDIVGGMLTGNTETGITVTYQDSDGTIDFVVASQTDENFTTADHSKLDGIEASADVTDTANVTSAGALMDIFAIPDNLPPLAPVRPMVFKPSALAVLIALITFFELPEVLIPKRMSSGFPKAITCWANPNSGLSSLLNAVWNPIIEGSDRAGSPPCSSLESSGPSLSANSGLNGLSLANCLTNSPAMCSQSAQLPPFPQSNSLPPALKQSVINWAAFLTSFSTSSRFG